RRSPCDSARDSQGHSDLGHGGRRPALPGRGGVMASGDGPVDLTIIGGFLGAGKTTLINHLLAHAEGRRLAVLVNDFGAINIDEKLIARRSDRVISLTNGCI